MTLDELGAKFREASWLMGRRRTVAVGQALIFSASNLDDAAEEVAAIYQLTEKACVQLTNSHHALEIVRTAATHPARVAMRPNSGQLGLAASSWCHYSSTESV